MVPTGIFMVPNGQIVTLLDDNRRYLWDIPIKRHRLHLPKAAIIGGLRLCSDFNLIA